MMNFDELVAAIDALRRRDLQRWVRESWVSPVRADSTLQFSDRECARVRLICTLRYEYEIEEDTMPVILSLLDQLYETRRRLNALAAAVAGQDSDVRDAILKAATPRDETGPDDGSASGAG